MIVTLYGPMKGKDRFSGLPGGAVGEHGTQRSSVEPSPNVVKPMLTVHSKTTSQS